MKMNINCVLLRIVLCTLLIGSAEMSLAKPQGELIIYHAGSLTVPIKKMIQQFNETYPDVTVKTKSGGSTKMARLISEKGETADIMASADYKVIDNNLIPEFADWNIRFATNRLVLCYTDTSRLADTINDQNWYRVLQNKEVRWGHSDPNLDPCGYRSLMVLQLAEKYYSITGLYEEILANRPQENVRSKAIELVTLLQSGNLDYAWEYRSVAVQHGLKYLELDDSINLGNYTHDQLYKTATVEVAGKKPGTTMVKKGKSITYGITQLKNAPNKEAAEAFLAYMLSKDNGLKILSDLGQPPFIPARVPSQEMKNSLSGNIASLVEVKK